MPIPVSAIVLTKNEEENLPDCLASLRWADEIVVVDSFSTDRTTNRGRLPNKILVYMAAESDFAWPHLIDRLEAFYADLTDEPAK